MSAVPSLGRAAPPQPAAMQAAVSTLRSPQTVPQGEPTRSRNPQWLFVAIAAAITVGLITWTFSELRRPSEFARPAGPALDGMGRPELRGAFAFLNRNAFDEPIRWDPCEPIRWVFNPRYAPQGALAETRAAVRRVTQATGLRFVYEGVTNEPVPKLNRVPYDLARYGDRWAPILVAWWPADKTDVLGRKIAAYGAPTWLAGPDHMPAYYVSGELAVNANMSMVPGFETPRSRGIVLQHELGHLVGLAHVDDPAELMYGHSDRRRATDWGTGDRRGLQDMYEDTMCIAVPGPQPPFSSA